MRWPSAPLIYEINTWVWLHDLSHAQGRPVTLADVPSEVWDALATLGADAVWLMGVWERSPAGRGLALANARLLADFRHALPDCSPTDVVGSPYCVRRYVVDERLGGPAGLAAARRQLARRGMRLLLDYVPNHVAPDHPWVLAHPEYFLHGSATELAHDPAAFLQINDHVIACGKDPYFPAWHDVLQLNAFDAGLRRAAVETVADIAAQCDGVRCDMAMLFMNATFARTWGVRAGACPPREYWPELIGEVKARFPETLFIAEAYWDLEWELQQQGFDYCYDKRLYDRLVHDGADSVRRHLLADLAYQARLVRFLENHDEPRAATVFPPAPARAAAVITFTLPGARLLHDGQLDGWQVRLPVFLGRHRPEPADASLQAFYRRLLHALQSEALRSGTWQLSTASGWPDNQTCAHLLTWCWYAPAARCLIVVNWSPERAQGLVQVPWPELESGFWQLRDVLSGATFERQGSTMRQPGLYVELEGWGQHVFEVLPL